MYDEKENEKEDARIQKLEEIIYKDIQKAIWEYYEDQAIKYTEKIDPQDAIVDFFSYLYRLIPPVERQVHYSMELLRKIESKVISEEYIEILRKFEHAFSEGKNMNVFLSNNIKKPRQTDFLRYTWHIYHLHMSNKFVEDSKQMKNNRSDTQLLCIICEGDVYFVDVISHPPKADGYFDIQIMKIIANNGWMEKIGFYEIKDFIPGSLEPKITEASEILEYYKAGINIGFDLEGKTYAPLEQLGVNRRPVDANSQLIRIKKSIRKLFGIVKKYEGFYFACNREGRLLGIVEFESKTGDKLRKNIF